MISIKLPQLERIVFQQTGCKNKIKQLIAPEMDLPINIVENDRSSITINFEGIKYCLTCNSDSYPNDIEYVLLTNIRPTSERLIANAITVKWWLKHPLQKEYTVNEVISSWKDDFFFKEENLETEINGLRSPQLGALHMILGHLQLPLDTATIVLPTGTGKTETMLSALVANQCKRLLVTVPSNSLRIQLFEKFETFGLLKKFGVIGKKSLYPIVGIINEKFNSPEELKEFLEKCNVIVTTMHILNGSSDTEQEILVSASSNIFIDEAHHVKAPSWNQFKSKFPAEKVIQFTATPFRNDGQRLDGKIIYNFPLKYAQEQGYFTKIDFIPIREYDSDKADEKIAEVAVQRLREDLKTHNHILMARCFPQERAIKIFELYKKHSDLTPVIIYSNSPDYKETYRKITQKEAKIIVCVDMLGEGFDLPELKIAAFHDIRKSLPITLQFAGRFTRTKYDEKLGHASFIANIADLDVRAELEELYADGANWNQILSDTSFGRINDEEEYKNLMDGFEKINNSNIPFSNIHPKFSVVVYKNKTNGWYPNNYNKGIPGFDDLEYKFHDINKEEKILVIITAKRGNVEWVNHKDIQQVIWDMIVVFWDTKNNLLFINSSDNGSLYKELAEAIIGDGEEKKPEIIKGIDVFKTFYNINRTKLRNVGLKYFIGKDIRFRMHVGSDVAEALSLAERQKGEKAFVVGSGFEDGEQVNIGASYKGRIWNVIKKGDLKDFKQWCIEIGDKLVNEAIDSNQILKETLIPKAISVVPDVYPVCIDWDEDVYMSYETHFKFSIDGFTATVANADIRLTNASEKGRLLFSILTDYKKADFELILFENTTTEDHYADFKIVQLGKEKVEISNGSKTYTGVQFFEKYIPTIWFADGSALAGNEYVQLKQIINVYPKDNIIAWNWQGVSLEKESQHVNPKITDSIQYKVIEELKKDNYDIIYDDDYSGEIADVVTLKLHPDKLSVGLYHLKFAIDGKVTEQVRNLYEVCGQAQKSVHWKHKDGAEFINHLLRRETKNRNGQTCSRLEVGTKKDVEKLLSIAKKEIPMEYEIYIVQPGFSKATATNEILSLLGVTENYLKEVAGINLKVISS
ncbi:MAG: helicase [Bacteroidetes bacterium HGW-Bacteroidetes-5]|jgi:superfamily II DNA or RNA helicase|nr:MAG: helicase [Bacteroidetes bacterium HGW-Bacteroidetes-5]